MVYSRQKFYEQNQITKQLETEVELEIRTHLIEIAQLWLVLD